MEFRIIPTASLFSRALPQPPTHRSTRRTRRIEVIGGGSQVRRPSPKSETRAETGRGRRRRPGSNATKIPSPGVTSGGRVGERPIRVSCGTVNTSADRAVAKRSIEQGYRARRSLFILNLTISPSSDQSWSIDPPS